MLSLHSRVIPLLAGISLALISGLNAQGAPSSSPLLRGDVDGDGRVTQADAEALRSFLVGKPTLTDGHYELSVADVNGDGRVTAVDAAIIARFAAGQDMSRYPVGRAAPQTPESAFGGAGSLTTVMDCTMEVASGTVSCGAPRPASGARADLIIGKPYFATVSSGTVVSKGNPANEDTTTTNMAVQNLIGQPIGTTNGVTSDSASRVFFHTLPAVTAVSSGTIASASIRIDNAYGTGNFYNSDGTLFAAGKPYFRYPGLVAPNMLSAAQSWRFVYSSNVTRFSFSVVVSAPVQYENGWITVTPAVDTVNVGLTRTLSATVRDASGATVADSVTWSSSDIALATVNASTGVVTGVSSGSATITATSRVNSQRKGTATIVIGGGPPTQLSISTQPSSTAQAGTAFAQQPVIQLLTASATPSAQAGVVVTASIASGGGTLGGTLTATTNASGQATFTDLSISGTVGNRTLTFSAPGLTAATSSSINVTAGTAAALAFSTQPSNVVASAPITPAVQVSIVDGFGNVVTGATDNVTVAIGTNPSGGTLSGTATVAASAGVATFSTLSINLVGTGYTLSATSGSLTGAASSAFNVTHGPLDHYLVEQAGGGPIGNQLAGTAFNVRITAQDQYNNTVTSFTGTVGFTSTPSGGISAGTTSGAFTAGVLSSHSITFGTPGSFTLTATNTAGAQLGTSNSFDVQAPPTAVNEGPAAGSSPGQPFHAYYSTSGSPQTFTLSAPGVLSNDNLGFPAATITSFGADSLGGSVTTYVAGSTVSPLPGTGRTTGSLSVAADGTITFTPPDGFTGNYVFRYRLTNVRGTSDAQVTIAVGARPVATADAYPTTLVGNVPINTATSSGFNVTSNDQGDAKVLAVVAGSEQNGTVTLNSSGTFTFRPAAGFRSGNGSFQYTVTNGFGTTAAATVTVPVGANVAWFVNAGAASNGDGRFDSPKNCFVGTGCFSDITTDAANDRIFLYSSGTSYTGGVTLLNGQRLIGQGATGASFAAVMGVTWPADAGTQPSIGGTAPTIITSGTTAVTLNSASGTNTLQGFNFGNVGAAGTALAGSSFGTLTISEVGINTNGQALNLATGTLSGSLTGVTSTAGASNIALSSVGTSSTFSFGSGALSGATTAAFNVSGGSGSFSYSGTIANTSGFAVKDQNRTGGTISLTGQITAGGSGISITNTNTSLGSTGTVELTNINNTISAALGQTALTVTNTTIGSGGLKFTSISANGNNSATNGIVLQNTGATAGLTVSGSGSANSGGTIQNTTGVGISLSSTLSPSFAYMNIQSTARSGINGTGVTNFSFTNGTINNSGTSGTVLDDSNIDFYAASTATDNNVSGVVTITGNVLTNALGHGIDIGNGNGTISDLNISNNTITSNASAASSKGSGMRIVIDGSASTVANLTKATIANNQITNFPSDAGIRIDCGNGSTSGAAGTCGTTGSATNKILITGNRIAGDATTKMGTKAIYPTVAGKGQANFEITNNGTAAEPIRNIVGHVIDLSATGQAQVTATISGNRIQANNGLSARGITVGADSATSFATTALLTATISGNIISNTDGAGINATALRSGSTVKATITNNTVSAPTGGIYGIQVTTASNTTATPTVCVSISGNTTAGGSASGTTWPGIGLGKRAASTFGIVGLSPSPAGSPTVENYMNGLNTSTSGSFGTGGTALISDQTGFTSCTM